jgi:hypothetical protein
MKDEITNALLRAKDTSQNTEIIGKDAFKLQIDTAERLKFHLRESDIWADYPYSIFVQVTTSIKDEIVIEISPYGPIAALFQYGQVPIEIYTTVKRILHDVPLLIIEGQELRDLEDGGQYKILFKD